MGYIVGMPVNEGHMPWCQVSCLTSAVHPAALRVCDHLKSLARRMAQVELEDLDIVSTRCVLGEYICATCASSSASLCLPPSLPLPPPLLALGIVCHDVIGLCGDADVPVSCAE